MTRPRPTVATSMPDAITSFRDEFNWLSNFSRADVMLDGEVYRTVEHAYQAAKTTNPAERATVRSLANPRFAKWAGRKVSIRADWEAVKLDVMLGFLRQKFTPGTALAEKLLATGDAHIEEGNHWGDVYWGTVDGKGANHLGRLLMQVRDEVRAAQGGRVSSDAPGTRGGQTVPDIVFSFRSKQWGWLSQFASFPFTLDGVEWPTAEHYYQAQKSTDPAERERIRAAPTAKQALGLGRRAKHHRSDWTVAVKIAFVERGIRAKLAAHPELREKLLATGDAVIRESLAYCRGKLPGPDDVSYHIGPLWMRIRDELRQGDRRVAPRTTTAPSLSKVRRAPASRTTSSRSKRTSRQATASRGA